MGRPILCLDFDGCINSYTSGWKGAAVIPDPPVPGAICWLLAASQHFRVVIYSSRSKEPAGIDAMRGWLRNYAGQQAVEVLNAVEFAHEKPAAFLTIDDRCICFDGDFGALDPKTLLEFQPWHKRATQMP